MEHSSIPVDFPNVVNNLLSIGMIVVDNRYVVILWNRFMELNSNLRAEEVLGKNLFDVFPELNRNWMEKKIKSCLILKTASFSSWKQRPYLLRFRSSPAIAGESEFMYQDASIFPVYDQNKIIYGACIAIQDMTELAEALRALDRTTDQALDFEELNRHDALTGLYNRKFFDEQITQEISNSRRYNWPLTMAMIDVDNFKTVNDNYGHVAGDAVLRLMAKRLQGMLRSSDTLCRYGGEEFSLFLPHTNLENTYDLLTRLRISISDLRFEIGDGITVGITISVGIADLTDNLTAGQLVNRADESLYKSKRAGRNCVTSYSCEIQTVE